MKILTPGHRYQLDNFEPALAAGNDAEVSPDGKVRSFQEIQFIEKGLAPAPELTMENAKSPLPEPGTMVTINNGTTNEEVLAVLIDRLQFLNGKFPCRENSIVLTHLETALLWLNKRTADRMARGVEGKHVK